jgi:hypothetical protein
MFLKHMRLTKMRKFDKRSVFTILDDVQRSQDARSKGLFNLGDKKLSGDTSGYEEYRGQVGLGN